MSEELTLLKERAATMGLSYKANIGVEALKAKIEAHLKGEPDESEKDSKNKPKEMTAEQMHQAVREQQLAEQRKLVRVRVTCLNPAKAHARGEIFTISNAFFGTVRRYVPFGEMTDEGWHIEQCIYEVMKERRFNSIRIRKDKTGLAEMPESRLVPEFAIEVLPDLTPEEIERLARVQAAAEGN